MYKKRISQLFVPRFTITNDIYKDLFLWTLVNNIVYHFVFSPCPSSTAINCLQKSCLYYSRLSLVLVTATTPHKSRFQNQSPQNSCFCLLAFTHIHRFSGLGWYSLLRLIWYELSRPRCSQRVQSTRIALWRCYLSRFPVRLRKFNESIIFSLTSFAISCCFALVTILLALHFTGRLQLRFF